MTYTNLKENSNKAMIHTLDMRRDYPEEINYSVTNTTLYKEPLLLEQVGGNRSSESMVWDCDSISAAFKAKQDLRPHKICILNFASFKFPGGKFFDGFMSQEEALCHNSYLYNVLAEFEIPYYKKHLAPTYLNQHMYRNEALYSPKVRFFLNDETDSFDVLTISAPNYKTGSRLFRIDPKRNKDTLESRIEFLSKILLKENVDCAILGAFGCGVFGQNPHLVAQLFKDTFAEGGIQHIIYAVPADINEINYKVFVNRIEKGI